MPDYSVDCSTRSEAENHKIVAVMWTIPNFTSLLEGHARDLRTKSGDCKGPDHETKFQLKMKFLGRENDLLEIYYLAPAPMFLKTILTICLKCYKERSIVLKEYHMVQPGQWQFLGVLYKRDIMSYDGCDTYLNEGSLSLKFQFMINKEVNVAANSTHEPKLSRDLENMFLNSTFSDVTVKSVEGAEFPAHKAILASRSAVLKAHFDHNTIESQTNIIESPLKTEVLKEVLTYIYTDNAPKVALMPVELLAAADFYHMDRLKSLCEDALYHTLTVDNAIEILQLADLHSAFNLRRKTLEFIGDGHASVIVKTKSWAQLKSVTLIKTILEFIVSSGQLEADDLR